MSGGAPDIDAAMRSRHAKDLIVGECKDGPTWGGSHLRLDYWVLRRSWTNPAMIGYEVKSSRADWLKDKKWQNYLPLCNELWFIAAPSDILPGEIPEAVGHLRPVGTRLITVKRATWREIEPPVELLTYILMCRARIGPENGDATGFWGAWLAEKAEKREIGHRVSKALREQYGREVREVRAENERLRAECRASADLRAALEAKGIDWKSWMTAKDVEEELRAPRWTRQQVEAAHKELGRLLADGHP